MKSVCNDDCLSRTQVLALHNRDFSEWRETAELRNSQCSGRSLTLSIKINVNTVRTLIEEDRSLTCHEMDAIMDCSKLTIENIMKKLGMRHVVSMWVAHNLTKQQL